METIKNKIRKLLALAEGAKAIGSLAEAENAMAKANKLLMEYNLQEYDIGEGDQTGMITKVLKVQDLQNKSEGSNFTIFLTSLVANYNLCNMIIINKHNLHIFGKPDNVDLVITMVTSIIGIFRKLAKEAAKGKWGNRNTFIRSFYMGALAGLKNRLNIEAESFTNNEKGLVVRNEKALDEYQEKEFGLVKEKAVKTRIGDRDSYDRGYKAGNQTSLTDAQSLN